MKNVLFIGDLRTANNYGAIATTENLIKLVENENLNINIRYIDYRSLYNPTPADGFPPCKAFKNVNPLKRLVKPFVPTSLRKKISACRRTVVDFVPWKFCQYEAFYQQMVEGTAFVWEKKMLDWADIVYINGEGNVVHGTDANGKYRMGARYIFFMAWLAKIKYGKPTILLNHTVDPDNVNAFEMISAIYPFLDVVYVRECLSLPVLEAHGVHNGEFVPDALFSYTPTSDWHPSVYLNSQIDFSKPYICLGDSSGLRNGYSGVKWNVFEVYCQIIDELKKICPQIVFVSGGNMSDIVSRLVKERGIVSVSNTNTPYTDLYQVLKRASIFISGRWHASILSVMAGTPILLWGSDSHKTKSLYPLMDYNYRFFEVATLPVNIPELMDETKKILSNSAEIKNKLSVKVTEYANLAKQNARILKQYV